MAANLLRAGFPVTLHNRTPGREARVVELAGRPCQAGFAASAAAASRGAAIVCLCLSDDAAVEEVLLGPAGPGVSPGLLSVLAPETLVIDFSTVAPATSRRLAARLASQGVSYLDAPVTGGTEGARAGSLSVLVGGSPEDLERARPVLEVVGSRISHIGPVGAGQQAKAVNQVLVAGSYGAVAEAMALGSRLGLPMPAVVEALRCGAAGSWALDNRSSHMLSGEFPLGFRLALHRKDLAIALEAASAVQLELPLTRQVAAMEDALMARGHGDQDVSALVRWFNP
jgi:3-hydroxyisobutyrate dehydrogenase-like beta-hydroxyacid dehydrogenase